MLNEIGKVQVDNYSPGAGKDPGQVQGKKDTGTTTADGTPLPEDKVTISSTSVQMDSASYAKSLIVEKQFNVSFGQLRDAVNKILSDQGITSKFAVGDKKYDLKTMTQEEAKALTADDGYWGVNQTSDRIAQFAISAGGNDPSKLDKMKDALNKGFDEAKKAFGGSLPDISEKTLKAALDKLDKWAADTTNGNSGGTAQQA